MSIGFVNMSYYTPMQQKKIPHRINSKAPLEQEALTFARQALVDWVINVNCVDDSVLLTIEIEHAAGPAELTTLLERICKLLAAEVSAEEIAQQRQDILQLLHTQRPALTF